MNNQPVPQPRAIDLGGLRPEEVAASMSHLEGFVYLDSASAAPGSLQLPGQDPPYGEISLLTAFPTRTLKGNLQDTTELRNALRRESSFHRPDYGIPLGGAFGFVAFDGSFSFGIYERLLFYSHAREQWYEVGNLLSDIETTTSFDPDPPEQALEMSFATDRDSYCSMVERAHEYIGAGDIYQVNLTHGASAPWTDHDNAFRLYEHLRAASPSPFAAYLDLDGYRILSSSPELFLKISGDGVTTRPIKGTRPRFSNPVLDEKSAYDLITSPKELSELVMITDLERNDLGRVCRFGSIHATDLLKLERFAQVFHLVSTIQGTLRPEHDHVETLCACFPGGSISGAPKKRALEIIQELEPESRGLYTGAIGYLGFNGESQFNIAIRTAVIHDGEIRFQVGAGIVADSDPVREYEETLHKAAGFLSAVDRYNTSTHPGRAPSLDGA